jgi:hypothetical protein
MVTMLLWMVVTVASPIYWTQFWLLKMMKTREDIYRSRWQHR